VIDHEHSRSSLSQLFSTNGYTSNFVRYPTDPFWSLNTWDAVL